MATLASDLLTYFRLVKKGCRDLFQTWHQCSLWGPDEMLLLLCRSEIQYGRPGLWLTDIFSTSSQAGICFKLDTMFLMGSRRNVTFMSIQNPIWLPWPLTDIFSTSSQERVQGSTPHLAQIFLMGHN